VVDMDSPTIPQLRGKRQARRPAYASNAACHWLATAESAVVAQHPFATSVQSGNAHRWTVLPISKLARLVARSYPANVRVGAHERPANTYNLNEAARAADGRARVDVRHRLTFGFDLWLARLNRNPQAHPGRRGPEGTAPARSL
jgi:hypothetical protein